jgi:hypothetical protein
LFFLYAFTALLNLSFVSHSVAGTKIGKSDSESSKKMAPFSLSIYMEWGFFIIMLWQNWRSIHYKLFQQ